MILYPKIRLMQLQKKYGESIKVVHHYGTGLLMEYKKGFQQLNDSMAFIRKMSKENQSNVEAFAFNIGPKIGISFVYPELIKQVHKNHDAFQKIDVSQAVVYLFSNSLIYATGKQWQRQRQFLGKSFHFEEIKNYLPCIKDICIKTSNQISEDIRINPQKEIQVVKICEKVTSEVVFRVFFGSTQENILIEREDGQKLSISEELVSIVMDSFRILQQDKLLLIKSLILKRYSMKIFPLREEKSLHNRLIQLKKACETIVLQRKKQLQLDPALYKNNFLDLYLKEMIQNSNTQITIDEIIANFCGLFFAGTDTTGNMTGVALYYLSLNPQIQKEAREEVIQIISKKNSNLDLKDQFNYITFEDLSSMNLINSILKESLRLIPPAIGVFPRYANRDIKIGQFELKKGDLVNTHFIYNQSNPSIFQNPEQFDPKRWMNGNDLQFAFSFTPFSLGPRNCIGQHLAMIEGKCMLANFLLKYDILPNKSQNIGLEMKIIYGLSPDNLVYFKQR
ncbi:cytochrome P450 family monooxygenase (macronuclear) [Tetrahymena thermophila SB210]|uniref:Cytochrome P450 family monooxygenase n=2 Tax=Tetrahymena thermophila TaxID=5911 RepID=Q22NM6_TETTS|nr:cytochrome P450 family monooxygenase [Tetrahymena thermophila SB210]EAR86759.2 cytochrome P450 family monooxygenase [Tetrahymena thermophila SB210]|eukprot:XP_001007004.2 cytochrome P450 family monooxygenase [Tetrahymena thermophila SB210]